MYEFPVTAITHYHRLSVLKQHRFILLRLWRSEVRWGSHWAKTMVLADPCSLLESLGVTPFLCLFQYLEAACILWLMATPSIFKAIVSNGQLSLSHITSLWRRLFCLLLPLVRILVVTLRSPLWLHWSSSARIISFFLILFFKINKFIYLFIYFCLCWVFIAAPSLSLVVVSGGYSLLRCTGFSLQWLLLLRSKGSRHAGFSSCGSWAQ